MTTLQLPVNHINGFEMPTKSMETADSARVDLNTPRPLVIRSVLNSWDEQLATLEELGIGHVDESVGRHSLRFVLTSLLDLENGHRYNPTVSAQISRDHHSAYVSEITFSGIGYCFRRMRSDQEKETVRPLSSLLNISGTIVPNGYGLVGSMKVTPEPATD